MHSQNPLNSSTSTAQLISAPLCPGERQERWRENIVLEAAANYFLDRWEVGARRTQRRGVRLWTWCNNAFKQYTIRSIVCEASCHLVTWSLRHSVTKSLGHSVTLSLGHLVTHFNLSTNWLTNELTHNIRIYRSASQTKIKTLVFKDLYWQTA